MQHKPGVFCGILLVNTCRFVLNVFRARANLSWRKKFLLILARPVGVQDVVSHRVRIQKTTNLFTANRACFSIHGPNIRFEAHAALTWLTIVPAYASSLMKLPRMLGFYCFKFGVARSNRESKLPVILHTCVLTNRSASSRFFFCCTNPKYFVARTWMSLSIPLAGALFTAFCPEPPESNIVKNKLRDVPSYAFPNSKK